MHRSWNINVRNLRKKCSMDTFASSRASEAQTRRYSLPPRGGALPNETGMEHKKDTVERNNADRRDGGAAADVGRAYNDAWYDRGTKVIKTLRTSLVVDPPDGRIPPMLPEATKRQQDRAALTRGHQFDGPENRSL